MSKAVLLVLMVGSSAPFNMSVREQILNKEKLLALGKDVELTPKERLVDEILLKMKCNHIKKGLINSTDFLPRLHFFKSRKLIEQEEVYEFINKFPKGASLHTHLSAAVSVDYLFKTIIESDNLYLRYNNNQVKLRYFDSNSSVLADGWKLLKELRSNGTITDEHLLSQISLETQNPEQEYSTLEQVWTKFMGKFSAVYDMYSFRPFFIDVLRQILKEFIEDKVFYVEFRTAILNLHELNGTVHPPKVFLEVFEETVKNFKQANPSFIGARLIISISRRLEDEAFENVVEQFKELKSQFPDVISGFDLIGFEELGRPLSELKGVLQKIMPLTNFYFHAGETNWFGTSADLNILDAVLMGSKRIGHGFSLVKHPEILKIVKESNVAIEVTPISNQVLKLVDDLRNHPAASLIAQGLPIIICNDDPTFWGAKGLSHDWYLAFMTMLSKDSGIAFLKKWALDSIRYSAMKDQEKDFAIASWNQDFDKFLDLYLNPVV